MSEIDSIPEAKKIETNLFYPTLWIWFLTMAAIRVLHELRRVPWVNDNIMLLTGLLLIYVPIAVLWKRRERMDFFETSLPQLLRSLGNLLLLSVVVFTLIEIANRFFQSIAFHRHYVGGNYHGLAQAFLFQVLLVALPEEFFYRGFVQERFDRIWGRPWKLFGAPVGKSLFFTSFLFAFSHSLVTFQWWHFSIFFPALAFGWLKEKTNAITAGVLFHALCNTYSLWVVMNYR